MAGPDARAMGILSVLVVFRRHAKQVSQCDVSGSNRLTPSRRVAHPRVTHNDVADEAARLLATCNPRIRLNARRLFSRQVGMLRRCQVHTVLTSFL